MSANKVVRRENVGEVIGKAEFKDSTVDFIKSANSNSVRLDPTLTYYIPKQWAHTEKLREPITASNGQVYTTSNKFYVIGCNENGVPVTVTSVSYNSLNRMFYEAGSVIEAALNKDGVWRAKEGSPKMKNAVEGRMSWITEGLNIGVRMPVFFRAVPEDVLTTKIRQDGNKFHFETKKFDGKDILDLESNTVTTFKTKGISPIRMNLHDALNESDMQYIID